MALSGIPTKAMNYLTDRYVVVEEIRKTMLLVLLYTDFFFRLQSLFFLDIGTIYLMGGNLLIKTNCIIVISVCTLQCSEIRKKMHQLSTAIAHHLYKALQLYSNS